MSRVVALCGGIGGAKLALGLARVLPGDRLTVIANTGDDFEHLGLHVSPDVDTVLYTLSGRADPDRGWGRAGETWRFMDALGELGAETWFNLGDSDLATHVVRTDRLRAGARLTEVTRQIATAFGIEAEILPASDDPVRTTVETDAGALPLQHFFVRHRCQPRVSGVRFDGAATARPSPEALARLEAADLVILCPSNPWLSIDPILAVAPLRAALAGCAAPRIAVSPLIGGKAVKGPLSKMMAEMGIRPGTAAIAAHYEGLIDTLVVDSRDGDPGLAAPRIALADTLMTDLATREALARRVLELGGITGDGVTGGGVAGGAA